MSDMLMPRIIAAGIYNARNAHKNREVTPNRRTTMFELELSTSHGGISYMDGRSVPITEQTLICAKPGQVRHTRLPFSCYFVHMMVEEGELYDRLSEIPAYITVSDAAPYEALFRDICSCFDTAVARDRLLLQSRILELVWRLSDHAATEEIKIKTANRAIVEEVIQAVREDLAAELTLEKMAAQSGFSPIHFHNCFKRATGMTLREFVEDQRIRRAVDLLLTTDGTLAEIAIECGFSSQAYFSYVFKRRMGKTPREYVRSVFARYEKEK